MYQSRNGFTMLEVGIAILIVGFMLTTFLQTQSYLIATTGSAMSRLQDAMGLSHAYVYAQRQTWYQAGQQQASLYSDDDMQYRYEQQQLAADTVLSKQQHVLTIDRIIGIKPDGSEEMLSCYRYMPPEKEEETS